MVEIPIKHFSLCNIILVLNSSQREYWQQFKRVGIDAYQKAWITQRRLFQIVNSTPKRKKE